MKVIYSRKETIGEISIKETACLCGVLSYQDASAFLTAARTMLGSSDMAHDPQTSFPEIKVDNGFLHPTH